MSCICYWFYLKLRYRVRSAWWKKENVYFFKKESLNNKVDKEHNEINLPAFELWVVLGRANRLQINYQIPLIRTIILGS